MNIKAPVSDRRGAVKVAVAAGLVSIALTACTTSYREPIVGAVPEDYRVNHPITIGESLATLDVPVGVETRYLPRGMEGNVMAFANAFLQSGSTAIAIVLPTSSGNAAAAAAVSVEIEGILVASGILVAAIEYRTY